MSENRRFNFVPVRLGATPDTGARRDTTEAKHADRLGPPCLADLSARAVLTGGPCARGRECEADFPLFGPPSACFFAPRSDREAQTTKQRPRRDTASCATPARPI